MTSYNGSVSLTLQGGTAGATLGGTLTVTASSGVATFIGLSLDSAGTGYTIQIKGSSMATTSSAMSVSPAAASQVVVTSQPTATATAGTTFGLTATAEDGYGNIETGFNGSLTVALGADPTGGQLQGPLTVQANSGVAVFAGLSLDQAGTGYTIQVSGNGLTPALSNFLSVSPAVASLLTVTTQPPASVTAGDLFSVIVTAYDPYGNVATGFNGSVSATAAGSTLSGPTAITASGGVATFSGLTLTMAGNNDTLQFSSSGLTSTPTTFVSVSPAAASQLVMSPQPLAGIVAGTAFGLTVTAEDAFGNLATGFNGSVNLNLAKGPAGAALSLPPRRRTAWQHSPTFRSLRLAVTRFRSLAAA